VGSGEAPEVYKEAVPGSALDVSVLEGFESEVCCAPREGGDNVRVIAQDIETSAHFLTGEVVFQDPASVVSWGFSFEDGTGRFEELVMKLSVTMGSIVFLPLSPNYVWPESLDRYILTYRATC
jgi:hypothetical protein